MSDARALYEQVIIDHMKNPRNYRALDAADRVVEGYNPLCGDTFKIYLQFDGDHIKDLAFDGNGCAISKASASLMTTAVKGKKRAEAETLANAFHEMLRDDIKAPVNEAVLGKLRVFSGVREFPMRVKCATLAWRALQEGLNDPATSSAQMTVTTE